MDLWYELAIRETSDLNGRVAALLEDAEATLLAAPDESDDDEE